MRERNAPEAPEGPKNTKAQLDFIKAQEDAWEEERTWPLWQVQLSGDVVEWVPRGNPTYWTQEDPDDRNSPWVPLPADELPDHASISENGHVQMTARATVTCHAKSEELAKMFALRDNPDYTTVDSVTRIDEEE